MIGAVAIGYALAWITTALVLVRAARPEGAMDSMECGAMGLLAGAVWPLLLVGFVIGRLADFSLRWDNR